MKQLSSKKKQERLTTILLCVLVVLLFLCVLTVLSDANKNNDDVVAEKPNPYADRVQVREPLGGERRLDNGTDDYLNSLFYAQMYMGEAYSREHFPEAFHEGSIEHGHSHIPVNTGNATIDTYMEEHHIEKDTTSIITFNICSTLNTGRPDILVKHPFLEKSQVLYYANLQDQELNENYDIWCMDGFSVDEFAQMLCELVSQGYVSYGLTDDFSCEFTSKEDVLKVIESATTSTVVFGFYKEYADGVMQTATITYYKDCIMYDWINDTVKDKDQSQCCYAVSIIMPLDYVLGYE